MKKQCVLTCNFIAIQYYHSKSILEVAYTGLGITFSSETQGIAKYVSSFSSLLSPQAKMKAWSIFTYLHSQGRTGDILPFYMQSDCKQLQCMNGQYNEIRTRTKLQRNVGAVLASTRNNLIRLKLKAEKLNKMSLPSSVTQLQLSLFSLIYTLSL